MKLFLSSLMLICMIGLAGTAVEAQTINKKALLADLNNSDGMNMDAKQKKKYEDINKRTANDLLALENKSLTKEQRDLEIDKIFDRRDNDIEGLFGLDEKLEDTRKAYRKQTRGLRLKVKAAKLIL